MFIFHSHALYVKVRYCMGSSFIFNWCLVGICNMGICTAELSQLWVQVSGSMGGAMDHLHQSALSLFILWENSAFFCSPLIIYVTNKCSERTGQKSNACLGNDTIPNVFYAVSHLKITGFMDKAGGWIWHWCKNAGIHSLLYCCSDRNTFLP